MAKLIQKAKYVQFTVTAGGIITAFGRFSSIARPVNGDKIELRQGDRSSVVALSDISHYTREGGSETAVTQTRDELINFINDTIFA